MGYEYTPDNSKDSKKPVKPRNRYMYLWTPLLVKWGFSLAASMGASLTFSYIYARQHLEEAMLALGNYDKLLEIEQIVNDQVLAHTTIIEGVGALLAIPFLLKLFFEDRREERTAGIVSKKIPPLFTFPAVIILSLAMALGVNNLIIMAHLSEYSSQYEAVMESLYSASFPVQLVVLGFLTPICEELTFRGLLYKRLRQDRSFMGAALFSTALFAILHINSVQMIYGFICGMIFVYTYEKYGTVWVPILGHIAANTFSVVATHYNYVGYFAAEPMKMAIVTIACAAIGSSMFVVIHNME